MRYRLRLSTQAVRDISDVLAFTEKQFGEKQRRIYQQIIRDALKQLLINPDHPRAKFRPEIHPDARTMHLSRRGRAARHLFLYRVLDQQLVDTGRLLHDSMDLSRHLALDLNEEGWGASGADTLGL